MRPVADGVKMNKGAEHQPHSGHRAPAPATGVGNESKANMSGAMNGSPVDGMKGKSSGSVGETSLRGAMSELKRQGI